MATRQIVKEFFEEQFRNTSQFFLYKDKQLLKEGKYSDYAREQIKKAGNQQSMKGSFEIPPRPAAGFAVGRVNKALSYLPAGRQIQPPDGFFKSLLNL